MRWWGWTILLGLGAGCADTAGTTPEQSPAPATTTPSLTPPGESPPPDSPTIPSATPSPENTLEESPTPGAPVTPTSSATATPGAVEPSGTPSPTTTLDPTEEPSLASTEEPSLAPTEEPSLAPTEEPSLAPTEEPTLAPTEEPSLAPTTVPTPKPTEPPTPDTTPTATPVPETPTPSTPTPPPTPTPPVDVDEDGYPLAVDCDDNNPAVNPDAEEICDGIDNNCDDSIDEGVTTIYYPDVDGDGYGDTDAGIASCAPPPGYITVSGDCDDTQGDQNPDAVELCDAVDNNCTGVADDYQPGPALIYDPEVAYSKTNNPNDVWIFGWTQSLNTELHPYTTPGSSNGLDFWYDPNHVSSGAPAVAHNATNTPISVGTPIYPAHTLGFHPGSANERSVIRFTVPEAGNYQINLELYGIDQVGTNSDISVLIAGQQEFAGTILGYLTNKVTWTSSVYYLEAGQLVDFALGFGTNGSYYYDSTAIKTTLTRIAACP